MDHFKFKKKICQDYRCMFIIDDKPDHVNMHIDNDDQDALEGHVYTYMFIL